MQPTNSELYHHGVKGQKWGRRKARVASVLRSGPVESSYGKNVRNIYTKDSKKLSTSELDRRIERLGKEKRYRDLVNEMDHPGKKMTNDILKDVGQVAMTAAVTAGVGYAVNKMTNSPIIGKKTKGMWFPGIS